MAGSLPKSGVQLAAEGAAQFVGDMNRSGGALNSFQDVGGRAMAAVGSAAKAAAAVIATAMVAAAAAVAGFVASSVGVTVQFEEQMSGVRAVLQETPATMEALSDAAIRMGADTTYSATEAAGAIEMLARNGLNAEQILNGAAEATLNLAAATGGELAPAADIMTDVMAIFGDEGKSYTDVINGITGVTVVSKFTMDDYALALAQGAGAAATFGVELDDFNAVVAATAPLFKSGSDAGTAFRTFVSRLVPASNEAAKAMQALGIITEDGANQFFDAEGNMRSMAEVAQILQNATADLSEEQMNNYLTTIFGQDAIRTAAALAGQGAAGIEDYAARIAEVDAGEQAAIRLDNLAGAVEQTKGAFESLQLIVGMAITPLLKDLLNTAVIPAIQTFGDFAAAILQSENPIGALRDTIATFAPELMPLWEAFGELGAAIADVLPSADTAQSTMATLAGVFTGVVIPALAAGISWFAQNLPAGIAAGQAAFTEISGVVASVMPAIQRIITSTIDIVTGLWQNHGDTILRIAGQTWEAIKGAIQIATGVIQGILAIFAGVVTGNNQRMWTEVASANERIWGGIGQFLKGILEIIAASFGTSLGEIISLWQRNFEKMHAIGEAIFIRVVAAVAAQFGNAKAAVEAGAMAMLDVLKAQLGPFYQIGADIIAGIVRGVTSGVGALRSAVESAARSALNAARSALGISSPSKVFAADVGAPISAGVASGITAGIPTIQNAVASAMSGALSAAGAISGVRQAATPSASVNVSGSVGVALSMSSGLSQVIDARVRQQLSVRAQATAARGGF